MGEAALVGVGLSSSPLHLDVCAPHSPTWMHTSVFFSGDKERKSNQLRLILLRGRAGKASEIAWHTPESHKAAVQAGGGAVIVKQSVLLQAESEAVEGKKQRLPLPSRYSQGLNTPRSELLTNFVQELTRSLSWQWQTVKGLFVCSMGLSIKLLKASFFIFLSLTDTCTQVLTPPPAAIHIWVVRNNHFTCNFLTISNAVTTNI